MASTNKTQNLQLNQWALSDPVLMEDFNADNRKIDEKVAAISAQAQSASAANQLVKLADVTTTVGAASFSVDLSHIDMRQYLSLKVYQDSNGANDDIFISFNGITDSSKYSYWNSGNAWWANSPYFQVFGAQVELIMTAGSILIFTLQPNNTPYQGFERIYKADVAPSALRSLEFRWNAAANANIPAGTRYIVMGVRK